MKKTIVIILVLFSVIVAALFGTNIIEKLGEDKKEEIVENVSTEVKKQGKITAVTVNLIFIDMDDEKIEFPRTDTELVVGDEVEVTMNVFESGIRQISMIKKITLHKEDNNNEEKVEVDNELVSTQEDTDKEEQKAEINPIEDDKIEVPVKSMSASGIYGGLADSRSAEITVNGESNIYTFKEELKEKFEGLNESTLIKFSYMDEDGQLKIISLNN